MKTFVKLLSFFSSRNVHLRIHARSVLFIAYLFFSRD